MSKGAPRLVPSCQRPIEPGMEISTILTSPRVRSAVSTLVELLLSDYHPPRGQDLRSTARTGENELEAIARTLGITSSRFPRRLGPAAARRFFALDQRRPQRLHSLRPLHPRLQ